MLLEVGMKIWRTGRGCLELLTIDRVTKFQAVVQLNERCDIRFDREQKSGYGFFAKGDAERRTVYYISDEKSDEIFGSKLRRAEAIKKFREIDLGKLSTEKIERINKLAQE